MKLLEIKKLYKTYKNGNNSFNALDGLSLSVNQGDFISIIGKSGCGKSTLLHLIGGVDQKTSGEIFINGVDITKFNQDKMAIFRRRNIGIIYQFFNLIHVLTVRENILLPQQLDKRKIDEEYIDKLLKEFDLKEHENNLPSELSGGGKQRTAILRAVINNPILLLCDEPTGNLDSENSKIVENLLKKLNKEYKVTILLVTHDKELAKIGNKIIEMKDGKIIKEIENA